jgi:hypothetical protein
LSANELSRAIDRAYDQKLRAGAAFHQLLFSKRASRRSLAALATEFRRAADLLDEAAALLPSAQSEGTSTSD